MKKPNNKNRIISKIAQGKQIEFMDTNPNEAEILLKEHIDKDIIAQMKTGHLELTVVCPKCHHTFKLRLSLKN